jgi:outer membrane biosynthesis protein TonB
MMYEMRLSKFILILSLLLLPLAAFADEPVDTRQPDPASDGRLVKPVPKPGNPLPEFPEMLGPISVNRGRVALTLALDKDGNVSKWQVLGEQPANYGFKQAVDEVMPAWKYLPALWGGNPVTYNASLIFMFEDGKCWVDSTRVARPQPDVQAIEQ